MKATKLVVIDSAMKYEIVEDTSAEVVEGIDHGVKSHLRDVYAKDVVVGEVEAFADVPELVDMRNDLSLPEVMAAGPEAGLESGVAVEAGEDAIVAKSIVAVGVASVNGDADIEVPACFGY